MTITASRPLLLTLVLSAAGSNLQVAVASLDKTDGSATVTVAGAFTGGTTGQLVCSPPTAGSSTGVTSISISLPSGTGKGRSVVGDCASMEG